MLVKPPRAKRGSKALYERRRPLSHVAVLEWARCQRIDGPNVRNSCCR